jgi:hypothetical protein
MLARDRKPEETVVTNLRIRESLRRELERAAEQHRLSLNKEIINRLEDSLEASTRQSTIENISSVANDLLVNWLRFGDRFLALEFEEGIKQAIRNGDLDAARSQLHALEKTLEGTRRRAAKAVEKDD